MNLDLATINPRGAMLFKPFSHFLLCINKFAGVAR
jgi:hypothetical protein